MRYKKITLTIEDCMQENACSLLLEMGIAGYELVDNRPVFNPYDDDYEELRPDLEDKKGLCDIIFYLEEGEDEAPIIAKIQKALPTAAMVSGYSDEEDWRDKWKDFFHSFKVGDILIKPSWEEASDLSGELVIEIDPGISFGTGAHETTRMCIEALTRAGLSGKKVLDAGCGSGILSIAAHRLGAKPITCLDIDPDCIDTTRENLIKNACPQSDFSFLTGNILGDKALADKLPDASFDCIVANILADIVINMLPIFREKLVPGGKLIASGIIEGKESLVKSAMEEAGFSVSNVNHDGEWYMIEGNI